MRARMGATILLAVTAASAPAQDEGVTEHISVEIDAGFLTDYDDASGMWNQGYDVGVTGLWALSAAASLCARFGVSHWSYTPGGVVDALVPDDADLVGEQSTGQLEMLSLTPMLRYQREEVLGGLGAFVAGGVGIAYVKTFALTEVVYEQGAAGTKTAKSEINETDLRAGVMLGAGLSRAVSSSSWLEVLPTWRIIPGVDTPGYFAISFGFRVRV